jgi:hypothetical protein
MSGNGDIQHITGKALRNKAKADDGRPVVNHEAGHARVAQRTRVGVVQPAPLRGCAYFM